MSSVKRRVEEVKQPRGGYLNLSKFKLIQLESSQQLSNYENINPGIVGTVIDYMTRFLCSDDKKTAFEISLVGSKLIGELNHANDLLNQITGLTRESIISACQLVGYDVCFRSGVANYRPVEDILPNEDTISNIIELLSRSHNFIKLYGPFTLLGFALDGAFTNIIDTGDGDFLSESALWDFKVSINQPTNRHTLQLLVYYLMGLRSINREHFKKLKSIGIFNPRLNQVYIIDIDQIDREIMHEVSKEVIGYKD